MRLDQQLNHQPSAHLNCDLSDDFEFSSRSDLQRTSPVHDDNENQTENIDPVPWFTQQSNPFSASAFSSSPAPSRIVDQNNRFGPSPIASSPKDNEPTNRRLPNWNKSADLESPRKRQKKRQLASRSDSIKVFSEQPTLFIKRFEPSNQKIDGQHFYILINHLEQLLSTNQRRYTKLFDFEELKWRVNVRGRSDGDRRSFGIFLECVNFMESDNLSTKTNVVIKMLDQDDNHTTKDFFEKTFTFNVNCNALVSGIEDFYTFDRSEMRFDSFVRNNRVKLVLFLKVLKKIVHQ